MSRRFIPKSWGDVNRYRSPRTLAKRLRKIHHKEQHVVPAGGWEHQATQFELARLVTDHIEIILTALESKP